MEPNPGIVEAASESKLYYGDIDNLELFGSSLPSLSSFSVTYSLLHVVGLQTEETIPVMPGTGLCPGYTISRAILADAIALTRGDRFYTPTPHNAWGLQDSTRTATTRHTPGFW